MNLKEHIVFLQEAVTVKKMEEGDFSGLAAADNGMRFDHIITRFRSWAGRVFGLERAFPANRGRERRFSGISTDTARQGRFYCSFSLRMISESTR